MNFEHLFNPKDRNNQIDISSFDSNESTELLRSMIMIRAVEKKLAHMRKEGKIGGPVHLGVGQEAIAAGISQCIKKEDRVFGAHRSHAHLLALNPNPHKLFAEVLGRVTGFSKGMGGSMHLWDGGSGFLGSVPIVSGTVPLAVGASLASKLQNNGTVAVSYLGDGAIEEGVVHESLNLASIYKLPVIFVVENNMFASHMHISQRQPENLTCRFAKANNIEFDVIDGNDVAAIASAAEIAITRARSKLGPSFIEAITYRWYGHVDWREDIDVGVSRSIEDVKAWRLLDPIKRLEQAMIDYGYWSLDKSAEMKNSIDREISESWEIAVADSYPDSKMLKDSVYKKIGGVSFCD